MKNYYLYFILFFVISTFLSCEKLIKDEYKTIDWTYPSNLPRDPDLVGIWYLIDLVDGKIISKNIYYEDGRFGMYSYDKLTKYFSDKNLWQEGGNGKYQMYWSTANAIITSYNLLRGSNAPNEPLISNREYRLSITKDSFYYIDNNSNKPDMVRKMPK